MTQYEYKPDNKSHNKFKIVDVGGQVMYNIHFFLQQKKRNKYKT